MRNTTDRQDEITAYPIEYEEISIFNPTTGFAAFLIPAVLVLIINRRYCSESVSLQELPGKTTGLKTSCPSTGIITERYGIVLGKGLKLFLGLYIGSFLRTLCGPKIIQPQPDRATRFISIIRRPLSGSLHFLCNDHFHRHSQPGDLYADFCIHLRTLVIYFRYFLAGAAIPPFWKYVSYIFPVHIRHQWLCKNQ